jgi:hypothetical protein
MTLAGKGVAGGGGVFGLAPGTVPFGAFPESGFDAVLFELGPDPVVLHPATAKSAAIVKTSRVWIRRDGVQNVLRGSFEEVI